MYGKWVCTDPDCFQFIRRDGNKFEMVEVIDIDMLAQSDEHSYIVLRKEIDMNNYSDEEIMEYVSMYYSDDEIKELDDYLVAECVLEQEILSGDNSIFEGTEKETENIVMEIIKNEND